MELKHTEESTVFMLISRGYNIAYKSMFFFYTLKLLNTIRSTYVKKNWHITLLI